MKGARSEGLGRWRYCIGCEYRRAKGADPRLDLHVHGRGGLLRSREGSGGEGGNGDVLELHVC